MLHFATCHLAVGGRLVFYTYSMNPIENEAVIATLLTQQKGFCWFHCSYVFCRSCVVCLSVSSITLKVVEQFSRNYVRGVGVGTKTLSIRLRDNLDPHPAMLPARGNNQWASAVFGHNTWVLPSVFLIVVLSICQDDCTSNNDHNLPQWTYLSPHYIFDLERSQGKDIKVMIMPKSFCCP